MKKQFMEIKELEEIAQEAHLGGDVSEHFTGKFKVKQNIDVDFPLDLLRSIDAECQQQKISRQDWIKQVCAEKIREIQNQKISSVI
jgi:hypothetical protein